MRFIMALASVFLSMQALAMPKEPCAEIMDEASYPAKLEIADLMLEQARLSDADAALKSLLQKNIEQKITEFKGRFGEELNADEIKKLITQKENESLKKEKQEQVTENQARSDEDALFKWTRQKIHKEVKDAGPFLNEHQFFTSKDGNLALYDFKKEKYVWERSLQNEGQEVSRDSELLLTPQKDLLVIVNHDGIGLLDLKTDGYKVEAVETRLGKGFRFSKISQDGKHLFLGGEDGESIIYEIPSLKLVFKTTQGSYPKGKGIVESLDGRYVFFIRSDGNQVLFDLKAKKEVRLPNLKSAGFYHCHDAIFSQDSNTLTIVNHHGEFIAFDIATRTLKPSPYQSYGENLYTTADGEYVIVARDTANSGSKDQRPFTILKASTGEDVTPDLSEFDFDRVYQLWVFPEQSKFVFLDSIRQLGARYPDHNYLYMVDLKSFRVSRYEYDPKLLIMYVLGFTPDGRSLLTRGNGGPVIEFY